MGRFGNRNSLSINVQIPPYFSLYILSIDLLNKCQWHLILYILLLVLDSYNIMNHYFLYLFKWVPKYHYGPKLRASVSNYIMNHYLLVQSQMSKWGTNSKSIYYYGKTQIIIFLYLF